MATNDSRKARKNDDEDDNKGQRQDSSGFPRKFALLQGKFYSEPNSQLWTRRQNPQWKPRRASVATCRATNLRLELGSQAELTVTARRRCLALHCGDCCCRLAARLLHGDYEAKQACRAEAEVQAVESSLGSDWKAGKATVSEEAEQKVRQNVIRSLDSEQQTNPVFASTCCCLVVAAAAEKRAEADVATAIATTAAIDDDDDEADEGQLGLDWQFQEKQRKFLIYSMAVRRLLGDGVEISSSPQHDDDDDDEDDYYHRQLQRQQKRRRRLQHLRLRLKQLRRQAEMCKGRDKEEQCVECWRKCNCCSTFPARESTFGQANSEAQTVPNCSSSTIDVCRGRGSGSGNSSININIGDQQDATEDKLSRESSQDKQITSFEGDNRQDTSLKGNANTAANQSSSLKSSPINGPSERQRRFNCLHRHRQHHHQQNRQNQQHPSGSSSSKQPTDMNQHLPANSNKQAEYHSKAQTNTEELAGYWSTLDDDDDEELLLNVGDDESLESSIIESWLDDNPAFVEDYFMRKASRQLIDRWLIAHAKVNNTNLQQIDRRLRGSTVELPNFMISSNQRRNVSFSSIPLNFRSQTSGKHSAIEQQQQQQQQNLTRSGATTPIRKISATDFESKTGNAFLRPMISTTPDGRPTFLAQHINHSLTLPNINDSLESSKCSRADDRKSLADKKNWLNLSLNLTSSPNVAEELIEKNGNNYNNNNETSFNSVSESESVKSDDESVRSQAETSTSDTFDSKDEIRLIFGLVKNICNDLDIRTLLHKILKNIALLINADKSSLFLVSGAPGDPNRHLVSQLFNVDQDSPELTLTLEAGDGGEDAEEAGETERQEWEVIRIPWGRGLVGYVAKSGESVNIENCYDDPRFTNTIDQLTGYKTKHMLCAPIFDKSNEIVGVAQVINKRDGNPFSKADELKFKRYLQFCGIGLRNAQSYEYCKLENKRNQVLLDLAKMVFEEQSTIEQVVYRIMLHTQSLLECQRCQVLLIDDGSDDLDQLLQHTNNLPLAKDQKQAGELGQPAPEWQPQCQQAEAWSGLRPMQMQAPEASLLQEEAKPKLFNLVFDLECEGNDFVMHSSNGKQQSSAATPDNNRFPLNIGITSHVAETGETLNIEDAYQCSRFDKSVDENTGFRHKSILCMPIRDGQRQIIGVSQLINKKNGRPFNKNDENLFEAFAIFCGLGIHNTLMYEKVLKIMAKQRVTFEVLSYHATAPLEEAKKLCLKRIPSSYTLKLGSLKFHDFSLDDELMLKSCLRFFLDLDLIRRFQIDQLVFCNWILSVQKNYRKETYHPIVGE